MVFDYVLAVFFTGAVIILVYLARRAMQTPVPKGPGISIEVVVSAGPGAEQTLERTVDALCWFVKNGTLPAEAVVIRDRGLNVEGREIARRLTCRAEVELEGWTGAQGGERIP